MMILSLLRTQWRLWKNGQFEISRLVGIVLAVLTLLAIILYIRSQNATGEGVLARVFG